MKTLRILAIDDHEMTMLGYKFILESINFDGYNIIVDTATDFLSCGQKAHRGFSEYLSV